MRTKIPLLLRVFVTVGTCLPSSCPATTGEDTHTVRLPHKPNFIFSQNMESRLKINTDIPGNGKSGRHFLQSVSEALLHYHY
jgi:hypothetical protein